MHEDLMNLRGGDYRASQGPAGKGFAFSLILCAFSFSEEQQLYIYQVSLLVILSVAAFVHIRTIGFQKVESTIKMKSKCWTLQTLDKVYLGVFERERECDPTLGAL